MRSRRCFSSSLSASAATGMALTSPDSGAPGGGGGAATSGSASPSSCFSQNGSAPAEVAIVAALGGWIGLRFWWSVTAAASRTPVPSRMIAIQAFRLSRVVRGVGRRSRPAGSREGPSSYGESPMGGLLPARMHPHHSLREASSWESRSGPSARSASLGFSRVMKISSALRPTPTAMRAFEKSLSTMKWPSRSR